MKTIPLFLVMMLFSFSACVPQKKLVDDVPFELGKPTCYDWVGGRAESGRGTILQLPLVKDAMATPKLQQAYFRGKVADIKMEKTTDGWLAKANFRKNSGEKRDRVMHADPMKEVGNQPPMIKEKFPFELKDDECVISFLDGDTVRYFKVSNIKQTKQKNYR